MLHRLRGSRLAAGETEGAFVSPQHCPLRRPRIKSGVATSLAMRGRIIGAKLNTV
jgi:hypothetical protein